MKFIFHAKQEELPKAYEALNFALEADFDVICGVRLADGSNFSVKKNKVSEDSSANSYTVWSND